MFPANEKLWIGENQSTTITFGMFVAKILVQQKYFHHFYCHFLTIADLENTSTLL